MANWEYFDENFDTSDGGALYISDNGDGTYSAAGVIWMDAVGDEKPYYAFVATFEGGSEVDDDNGYFMIASKWGAADAFSWATNEYVSEVIGEFDTIDEGVAAVKAYIEG